MNTFLALLLAGGTIVSGWLMMAPVFAQSATQIGVSISLYDASYKPIPNGNYEVRFALYAEDRTESDPYPSNSDSRIWEETQTIEVKNGILRAFLGEKNSFSPEFLSSNVGYYLGVRIGTDSEMFPRKKMSAVRNALNSEYLQGKKIGTKKGDIPLLGKSNRIDVKLLPSTTSYLGDTIEVESEVDGVLAIENGGTGLSTTPGVGQILVGNGSGYVFGTIGSTSITADSIDFTEIADILTLDANTDIALGSLTLSTSGTGTIALNNTGGFTVAGNTDFNGTSNDIAGTLNLSGGNLTSTGALTITPQAGSNLNIDLSTTGDFAVNTDQLYVDTGTGFVGIGDTTPLSMFTVGNGDLFQVNSSGAIAAATGITSSGTITFSGLSTAGIVTNTSGGVLGTTATLAASYITADTLDFTEFQDQLDLDASTDILADSAEVLSITNSGTGNSFLVNDVASDTTPFVIDASGNVGVGTTTPGVKLEVTGDIQSANMIRATGWLTGTGVGQGAEIGVTGGKSYFMGYNRTTLAYAPVQVQGTTINLLPSGASNGLFLDATGNVGVGTLNPGVDLDVNGSAHIGDAGLQAAVLLSMGKSTGGYTVSDYVGTGAVDGKYWDKTFSNTQLNYRLVNDAYNSTTNYMSVVRSGTTVTSVTFPNGNVGIGTTSPGAKLDVRGTVDINGAYRLSMKNQGTAGGIFFEYSDGNLIGNITTPAIGYLSIAGNNGLQFNTATAERMRITSTGNVGIGDTTPLSMFTVGNGDLFQINSSGAIAAATGITSSGTITFSGLSTAGIVTNTSGGVLGTTATIGASYITSDSLDFTEFQDQLDLDASTDILADSAEVLSITNTGTGNSFLVNDVASDTTPFVIDASGNVGIGTATPSAPLHVQGNVILGSSGTLGSWYFTQNTFSHYYGVDLTNPRFAYQRDTVPSGGSSGTLLFANSSQTFAAAGAGLGSPVNGALAFFASNGSALVERMRIISSGNVGIGDTTPDGLLDVEPTGAVTAASYGLNLSNLTTNATTDAINKYGAYITSTGAWTGSIGTATNNYGLYVDTVSGADNNYGAYIAGNVGIGTTSPTGGTLQIVNSNGNRGIYSQTQFTTGNNQAIVAEAVTTTTGTNTGFLANVTGGATGNYSFYGLAGTLYNAGNVGIGTTGPTYKLDISTATASDGLRIQSSAVGGPNIYLDATNASASSRYTGLIFQSNSVDQWAFQMRGGSGLYMYDLVNSASRFQAIAGSSGGFGIGGAMSSNGSLTGAVMTVLNSGNVGIGTNVPGADLQVNDGTFTTGSTPEIRMGDSQTYWKVLYGDLVKHGAYYGHIFEITGNEKMRITTSGNVGIGTTTPGSLLHISGVSTNAQLTLERTSSATGKYNIYTNTDKLFFQKDGGSVGLTIDNGNIGIGTSSPGATLDVQGTTNDGASLASITQSGTGRGLYVLRNVASATRAQVNFAQTSATGGTLPVLHLQQADTGEVALAVNTDGSSTYNFSVTDVGNVYTAGSIGVGTTVPDGKLHLSGTGAAPAKLIWERNDGAIGSRDWVSYIDSSHDLLFGKADDSGTLTNDFLHIQNDGSVGIGTTGPGYPLDVTGDVRVTGGLGLGTSVPGLDGRIVSSQDIVLEGVPASGTYITLNGAPTGNNIGMNYVPTISANATYSRSLLSSETVATGVTLANRYGVFIENPTLAGTGTITTNYGIYLSDQTSGGTDYAIYSAGGQSYFGGNVGIGTAVPSGKLTLSEEVSDGDAALSFRSGSGTPGATREARITAVSTGGGGNGHSLAFSTNVSGGAVTEYMRILSTGNVGIGTTSPNEKLDVNGAVEIRGSSAGYATTQSVGMLDFFNGTTRLLAFGSDASTFGDIGFYTAKQNNSGGSQVMTIKGSGNVGIGTTTPGAKLNVYNGVIKAETNTNASYFYAQKPDAWALTGFRIGDGTTDTVYMRDVGSAAGYVGLFSGGSRNLFVATELNLDRTLTLQASKINIVDADTPYSSMLYAENGNVGIGTTTPVDKLDIRDGNFSLTDADVTHSMTAESAASVFGRMMPWSGTDGGLWIKGLSDTDGSGLVLNGMIGVADPVDTTAAVVFRANKWNGVAGLTSLADSETAFQFRDSNENLVTILGSGNVGVGDTTPASLFTVGNADLFQIDSNGDIVKLKNLTYSFPSSHTTNGVLTNDGSGTLTWGTIAAASITADTLDFTEFSDTLDLDANTTINADDDVSQYGLTMNSDLSVSARTTAVMTLTQANDVTNDFDSSSTGLLHLTNNDTGSTASTLYIDQNSTANGAAGIYIDAPAAASTYGISIGTLTVGAGIYSPYIGGAGKGIDLTISALTSGTGIALGNTGTFNSGAFTGSYVNVNPTRTYQGTSTNTDTGKFLVLARDDRVNNVSGTYNITGDVAAFSSSLTETTGTITDSSNILSLAQNCGTNAACTGSVFELTNAGTGNGADIFLTNTAGTQTDGLLIKRNGAGGTTTNALHIDNTAGTLTTGILIDGTAPGSFILDSGSLDISGSGAITGATGITSSGTITFSGFTTNGGLLYTDGSGILAQTAAGTTGQALISGGAGAPTYYTPTAGSVLFAGTSGILEQDNANFFFDDSTNRLGIGTVTPGAPIDIFGTSNALRLSYDASNYTTLSSTSTGAINIVSSNVTESQLVIGTNSATDASVAFDGGAQDYFSGVDDTTGSFMIGTGVAVQSVSAYLTISSAGNTSATGQISATDGLVTKVNAGACDDTVFTADTDGNICIDSTNGRIYYRYSGAWHYSAQTAGFQIPNYEAYSYEFATQSFDESKALVAGDFLLPFVESSMEDGAVHGLYARFSDVKDTLFADEHAQINAIDLKTDTNATTLSALQASIDAELTVAGDAITALQVAGAETDANATTLRADLDTLDTRIVTLENDANAAALQVTTLQNEVAILKDQVTTITDFYTALDLTNVVVKDAMGNVDLSTSQVIVGTLSADGLSIIVSDPDKAMIGVATILPVAVDADTDGNDDYTNLPMTDPEIVSRDGQTVIVLTQAMTDTMKTFINFSDDPGSYSWTEKKKSSGDYIGFIIHLSKAVLAPVNVDWILVEEK